MKRKKRNNNWKRKRIIGSKRSVCWDSIERRERIGKLEKRRRRLEALIGKK